MSIWTKVPRCRQDIVACPSRASASRRVPPSWANLALSCTQSRRRWLTLTALSRLRAPRVVPGSGRPAGRVGSGRVGSKPWRVGSGLSALTRPDPPFFAEPVNVNFDSVTVTQRTLCKLVQIIQKKLPNPWNWYKVCLSALIETAC